MTREKLNRLIGEAYSGWDTPYKPLIQLFGEAIHQLTRIADGGLDEAINVIRSESTPAPDAPATTELVEAVKERVGNHDMLSAGQVFNILDEVLAAHEKAVR